MREIAGFTDNYTEGVSNTQRYKMLGNGWQVDTIKHIFSYIERKSNLSKSNYIMTDVEKLKAQLEFGSFVRRTRLEKHIGLRDFGSMAGINPAYISKMEMGESALKKEDIKKIAEILNLDTDILLAKANLNDKS